MINMLSFSVIPHSHSLIKSFFQVGSGFKFAYIVFEKPAGVRNSMNKMPLNAVRVASTPDKPILGRFTQNDYLAVIQTIFPAWVWHLSSMNGMYTNCLDSSLQLQ